MESSHAIGGLVIWHHVFLGLLIVAMCYFLGYSLWRIRHGELPLLESNWGNMAGDAGGWRMSTSLVYLLAFLVSAVLFLIALTGFWDQEARNRATEPGKTDETSSSKTKDAVLPNPEAKEPHDRSAKVPVSTKSSTPAPDAGQPAKAESRESSAPAHP